MRISQPGDESVIETARSESEAGPQAGARPFGGDAQTGNLDLLLALLIALALPFLALGLLRWTGGALVSLIVYYGLAGAWLYHWRLGSLDYGAPVAWPWAAFVTGLLTAGAITFRNWGAYPDYGAAGWAVVGVGPGLGQPQRGP